MRPPSSIVGTKPLGFKSRYGCSLLPPNLPPRSTRSKSMPSSPQHHRTFCTLEESFLPQILIFAAILTSARFHSTVSGQSVPGEAAQNSIVASLTFDFDLIRLQFL